MPLDAETFLGHDGPIARTLGGAYEPRPEQARMAAACAGAMASRGHLVVEAGTGVGKSFAYLVPAIERALRHGETVVIATNTIALQEQLVGKDIPLLLSALDDEDAAALRPVLVKGRGNYVSLRRLALASQRQDRLLPDAASRRSLAVIEGWASTTHDGTLSTLPPLERPGVWDRAQSDAGNCMGRRCPTYASCFYQRARQEMERGNLLICNHALFFSDLALRSRHDGAGFLPRYSQVILDEAHMVEDVASDHFGLSLGEGRVMHLLSMLYQDRTHKGFLAHLECADGRAADRAVDAVSAARDAAHAFFGSLDAAQAGGVLRGGRVPGPGLIENGLTAAMNELAVALRRAKESSEKEADQFELNAYAQRAADIALAAEALVEQTMPGCCYWVESSGPGDDEGHPRGRGRRVTIACSPIDVAPALKEHLFGGDFGVVMTSATLATRTVDDDEPIEHAESAFAHFLRRTGCEGAQTLQFGSPFDYARQLRLIVDTTMPEPNPARGDAEDRYEHELAARVLEHVEEVGGGAFVLFTSYRLLERMAERLEAPLAALGLPMLAQGRGPGAGSRGALLEAFRAHGHAVLLGAASFWQGVDVRGEALRCVILTRLPFDPPDRPLTEARLERIRQRGGDPFREESVPRAIIRFKQGFGRLIRGREDRGRVVVLDPRIVSKAYGRLFLRALPAGVEVERV